MTATRRWGRLASILAVLATVTFAAPAAADASTVRAASAPHGASVGLGRAESSAALPATPPVRSARASRHADAAIVPRIAPSDRPTLVTEVGPPTSADHLGSGARAAPSRGPPLLPSR